MKYAYRARKIQNKPIVNVIDHLAMEKTSMQQKIDQLEGKLKGLEEHGSGSVLFNSEMIDFDNDQWMQFFIDQLKNRTKNGASAVKALDDAKKEIDELKMQIVDLENRQTTTTEQVKNILKDQMEEMQIAHELETASLQQSLDTLLAFSMKILQGETPSESESFPVKQIIKQHFPREFARLERSSSKESLTFPLIHQTRAPSTNLVARSLRRKRITSDDLRDDDVTNVKPLEMELRETRKYLSQMEDELQRTKIRLHQTEAISEKSSAEISRLMEMNEAFRTGKNLDKDQPEIMSIKVLAEASIQTSFTLINEENFNDNTDMNESAAVESQQNYPVFSSTQNPADMNIEKLAEELSIATKAKVDLLKELSKVNKEAEKTRHHHQDQVFKLERELESFQREMNKIMEDHHEKDVLKDRVKDDYERKIKHQENAIQKLKLKQKELEKTLRDKGSGDRRLQECQQEVEKLTIQIAGLKKKIKEDHDKHQELESRKSKEIAVLNKQLEDESKKGRQLEMKSEMMRKKLDRKTEEIATIGKRRDSSIASNNTNRGRPLLGSQPSTDNLFDQAEVDHTSLINFQDADLSTLQTELKSARERMQSLEIEMDASSTQEGKLEGLQKKKSDTVLQIAKLRNEIRKKEHESLLFKEFSAELEKMASVFSSNVSVQKIIENAVRVIRIVLNFFVVKS